MISLNIRKELFWDTGLAGLDQEKNKSLIIERVLSYGNLSEIKILFDFYGKDSIRDVVKRLGYLDPKTFAFIVSYLGIPKKEMKCFTKKQLNPQHWD
jgi:hypothetical protein